MVVPDVGHGCTGCSKLLFLTLGKTLILWLREFTCVGKKMGQLNCGGQKNREEPYDLNKDKKETGKGKFTCSVNYKAMYM